MISGTFIERWRLQYRDKKRYCLWDRRPFFKIAEELLPEEGDGFAIDIGAGDEGLAQTLEVDARQRLDLLDGNPATVERLIAASFCAKLYTAPNPLPYQDGVVKFVHCSHLIEHLDWRDLDKFFRELDRVLASGGVMVISTPLLFDGFYGEFSHVRPYYPRAITTPFCTGTKNSTIEEFSGNYVQEGLYYRYGESDPDQGLGSCYAFVDFSFYLLRRLAKKFGIRHYIKTGYTLVLRKK